MLGKFIPGQVVTSFNTANDGWQYMWIIMIFGLVALGIAIERFITIYLTSAKGRHKFMFGMAQLLKHGKYDEAMQLAGASKLPIAKIIYAVLSNRDKGKDAMNEAREEVYLTEAPRLNRYLSLIQIVASVATLMGLLGTIWGLIYTFDAVANKPAAERPKALADGIAVAMATTYMGLTVAIPLALIQGWLALQSERVIEEMDEKGMKIVNDLASKSK
jgi:biopolymer transport protein ExbB/TolQ